MNNKLLSRSFWIVLYVIPAAVALDWFKELNTFMVVAPAALTGWFGGKFAESMVNRPK